MSDTGAGNWCLIESDPGVFTELIKGFGVSGVQVEELWSLDDEIFTNIKPVHGLIFLFKWVPETVVEGVQVHDNRLDSIFFAKQVINNACATQAILSVLMNTAHVDVQLGDTLTELKQFTCGFDAATRGLAISNSHHIRNVHNSFARQTLFELDNRDAQTDDDIYHFVSYVPVDGRVYELDGLCDAPLDHGAVGSTDPSSASTHAAASGGDWLATVRPVIEQRIKRYSEGEIRFNLMALISDRKMVFNRQLQSLQQQQSMGADVTDTLQCEMARLRLLICDEDRKLERYRAENVRRKHNYLPFIVELLKILAAEGRLLPLYMKAKQHSLDSRATKKQRTS